MKTKPDAKRSVGTKRSPKPARTPVHSPVHRRSVILKKLRAAEATANAYANYMHFERMAYDRLIEVELSSRYSDSEKMQIARVIRAQIAKEQRRLGNDFAAR